ncbi:MAG TPA: Wadjet anti-phage system protein JetD domain-containing protein [Terriglobales bacterium]|nr:Wadjet anti-phage system protein JetD domain-containing protein [Terriglobales bacterium]
MQRNHNTGRSWTRPSDLRAEIQKLWDRGEILASFVSGQALFPKRVALRTPTSTDMMERFDDVRAWIQELRATAHCRVEMRQFKHRILGSNLVPDEAWVDTVQNALALIGKQREASRFLALLEATRRQQPDLLEWLSKHPFDALALFGEWPRLLEVVAWVKEHPRPRVYLRQVDIPGIYTKFLEEHRSVLSQLLDVVLPSDAIDTTASGVTEFAKRYGFLEKPTRIRFRFLDPGYTLLSCCPGQDITLEAASFAHFNPRVSRVFITENEINFLAFPKVDDSLIIFGSGYGFAALGKAEWLSRCRLYYWGDIDTHGFAILDQFRGQFSDVQSFLMDRATLMAFESQWDIEEKQTVRDLYHLNDDERSVYDDLRDNRIRKNLRLEQERIGFGWVASRLSALR